MRWLVRVVLVLALLVVVGLASLLLLPGERIARVALDQIEAQTGRRVTLLGDVQLSYYPILGARTGAVEIANADWSDNGPLLRTEAMKIGVDLVALIAGDIKITGLEVLSPAVLMERHADGRANWEIGVDGVSPSGQNASAAASENALALSLDRALVTGGSLRYLDHAAGTDLTVRDLSLDLSWPIYRGAAGFALTARPTGMEVISVSGDIADLAALIEGAVTGVTAKAALGGATAAFDGVVGAPGQVQGSVAVKTENTSAALAAAGVKGVAVPRGLGQQVTLAGHLTLTQDMKLSLRDMVLQLDQNRFSGAVDVDLTPSRPVVTARLKSGALDFTGLASGSRVSGETATQVANTSDWSKAPIDASALSLANADLTLTAPSIALPSLRFQALDLRAGIDRSRAVVTLNALQGYGGSFAGQVVANNRDGLSVGGNVTASGVEMQQLLGDLAGITRFTGRAAAQLSYLGVGQSVHQIMNSLSGNGAINMGRGTIEGVDLDSLMRQGLATGGTTVFDELSASFSMKNGDLNNPDLSLKLPRISATGEGRVGLGKRDIDYLFAPQISSLEGQRGIAVPVRIRGPWASPKVWPDLERAIDLNLQEEKKKAEAKAKAKLEEAVKKELGIKQEEGQSLEDAAKEQLEKELLKGLGNLFN
ncbi:AsmA family protein [Thalassobius sp. Cn5-15]|uniref:AsmA family protein n=1 Tax=Thalassobius sp. Cn5-15 TaxID=2917763 RepID=UPI001EF1CF41|nr:AsmA family protein [Thalassobius sp. Cn5-15]MCG7493716.1 AsmA family protein [Thalassobius sp. Cn5-15]